MAVRVVKVHLSLARPLIVVGRNTEGYDHTDIGLEVKVRTATTHRTYMQGSGAGAGAGAGAGERRVRDLNQI